MSSKGGLANKRKSKMPQSNTTNKPRKSIFMGAPQQQTIVSGKDSQLNVRSITNELRVADKSMERHMEDDSIQNESPNLDMTKGKFTKPTLLIFLALISLIAAAVNEVKQ